MLYFGIFGLVFYKLFVMFSISTLEFIYLQKFPEKHKYLNLGSKMPYLGIFGLEFEKNIVIFEISKHARIYRITKFCQITKMPKFGTKNALFGYF